MEKKLFKYFAIRVLNTVVFRRTVSKIKRVRSVLYKPNSDFSLEQVTYTGGRVVGSMPYLLWVQHGGAAIKSMGCIKVAREQFRAMSPYVQKGE